MNSLSNRAKAIVAEAEEVEKMPLLKQAKHAKDVARKIGALMVDVCMELEEVKRATEKTS